MLKLLKLSRRKMPDKHCKHCKWSEMSFRGVLCNYFLHNDPKLPYYAQTQLEYSGFFPYVLGEHNLAESCTVFEEKGEK
jgi:hypothetical protein